MHPLRSRRLALILVVVLTMAVTIGLVLYALRQNISLFYAPTALLQQNVPANAWIRVGGVVVKNSVIHETNHLSVHFKLTDYQTTIDVIYQGILPDLFREGQGVVVQGQLLDAQHFKATVVLAKHDEKYMPPEVKATLKSTAMVAASVRRHDAA